MPVIGTNSVIDISQVQGHPDFAALKAAGVVGILHKATEGVGFHDANYAANKTAAKAAGLLWGAYHYGTGSDPTAQADEFMHVAAVGNDELLVLDFEDNKPPGTQMTLQGAKTFVQRVQNTLGRWPGFYSGNTIRDRLGANVDPLLANCWLWVAQYGDGPPIVQQSWQKWTMWQYTDGTLGPQPHAIGGMACDRDTFNGSAADLQTFWTSGGVTRP